MSEGRLCKDCEYISTAYTGMNSCNSTVCHSHADIPWNPSALLQQNNSISRKQILTMYFKIILIELMYISILFSCFLIGQLNNLGMIHTSKTKLHNRREDFNFPIVNFPFIYMYVEPFKQHLHV
jgi:hypothetical protein